MDDHSDVSGAAYEYMSPADIEASSPHVLKDVILYYRQQLQATRVELDAKEHEIQQLRRFDSMQMAEIEMVNNGYETKNEICRIKAEYTEKMMVMIKEHEAQLAEAREKYFQSLREIEAQVGGHRITVEVQQNLARYIEEIKRLDLKEQEFQTIKQDLERQVRSQASSYEKLQEEHQMLQRQKIRNYDMLSSVKNEQVLKDAQIATLQSQLESQRNRAESDRLRYNEEIQRLLADRNISQQERVKLEQDRLKSEQQRHWAEVDRLKNKIQAATDEAARSKLQYEEAKAKAAEHDRTANSLKGRVSALTQEIERYKNISQTYRQFADKKEQQCRKLNEQFRREREETSKVKSNEVQKEVERLTLRLKGQAEQFEQQRHNIEERAAKTMKIKVDEALKKKDIQVQKFRLQIEGKNREIKRLEGKLSEVDMLSKCNLGIINQKNALCQKQIEQISKKSKEIRVLQQEIAQLREKDQLIDRMNEEIREKDRLITDYETHIKESQKQLQRYSEDLRGKEKKIQNLEFSLTERRQIVQVPIKQLSRRDIEEDQDWKTENFKKEIKKLTNQLAEKTNAFQQLLTINRQLEHREGQIKIQMQAVKKELQRLSSKVSEEAAKSKQSHEELIKAENVLRNTNRLHKQQLAKLEQEIQRYEISAKEQIVKDQSSKDELNKLKEKVKLLQKDKVSAQKASEYKELLTSSTSLNETMREEIKKTHKQIGDLQQQLHQEMERSKGKTEPLQAKLRQLQKQNVLAQNQLAQLKLQVGNLQNEKRFTELKTEEIRRQRDNLQTMTKSRIQRYEEQLKLKQDRYQQDRTYFNEEITRLRAVLEDINAKHVQVKLENQMLKAQMECLTKNLASAIEQQKNKVADNEALRKRLRTAEELTTKMPKIASEQSTDKSSEEKAQLLRSKNMLEIQINKLKQQIERISQQKLADVNKMKSHHERLYEEKINEIAKLKQQLEDRHVEIGRLKTELKSLSNLNDDMKREHQRLKKDVETYRREAEGAKRDCQILRREMDNLKKDSDNQKMNMTKSQNFQNQKSKKEISRLTALASQLQRKLAESQRKEANTNSSLQTLQEDCNLLKARAKQEIDKMTKELRSLTNNLYIDKREHEKQIEEQNRLFAERQSRLEAELKKSREEKSKLKQELYKLQQSEKTLKQEGVELRDNINSISRELQLKNDRLNSLSSQLDKTGNQLSAESSSQLLLKEQIKNLQSQLSDKNKLKLYVSQLENKCRQLNQLKADLESKSEELQNRLADANSNIAKMKKQLNGLQRNNSDLNDRLELERRKSKEAEHNQVDKAIEMLNQKEREINDLKNAKLQRKKSKDSLTRSVKFEVPERDVARHSIRQVQSIPVPMGRDSTKSITRNAEECWGQIQHKIELVKQQNQRLKAFVGSYSRQ